MYDVISIRQSHPIEEVAARCGVELRPAGQRLVGRCPFHRDGRPSLVVYPTNNSYFCFGCGAGGDVIDFVARLNDVSFKEAAAMLAGPISGHKGRERASPEIERRGKAPTEAELEVVAAAAAFYHDALWRSRDALGYLAARGIDRSTARRCRLGFGCRGLADYLRGRGLSLDAARRVGLLAREEDTMLGRIVVPDLRAGRATWLTARTLDPGGPRYLNLRLPKPLLGLSLVRGDEVLATEGPFDWLTVVQWGLPVVALLGTHVSRSTAQTLARFQRVYLVLDADEAGRRAADGLVHDLNDLGRLPDGREAFQHCLELAAHRMEERCCTSDATAALCAAA
jgi:DNA primase